MYTALLDIRVEILFLSMKCSWYQSLEIIIIVIYIPLQDTSIAKNVFQKQAYIGLVVAHLIQQFNDISICKFRTA